MSTDRKLRKLLFATASAGAFLSAQQALANPDGANVISGDVSISGIGTDHIVVQNDSMRSVVDWNSFSIGTGETATFNQISNDAAILNRVTGGDISEIYGTLESNGQVYLINQNGILIGRDGLVDTNGFVASTLDVSNSEFLAGGDMIFRQGVDAGGGITVHGKIRSVSGGDIFLLSREIEIGETGSIDSNGGYVGLGAGEEILLKPTDTGDGRISIRAGKGKIVNRGTISGAVAELRAAGGNAYALAINNTGVVRATGAVKRGGKVLLTGGGKIRNSGKIRAKRRVVVRSRRKIINKGKIRAGAAKKGGEIIFEAPEIVVQAGSLLDVSGALGGGRMFIGGGFQGSGADRNGNLVDISENAQIVTVETGAVLNASATQSGDAGNTVVWADGTTTFAGAIVASAAGGAGGNAEVSGKSVLDISGLSADLSGTDGNGTLLLDPDDITISAAAGSGTATGANVILDDDIEALLQAGTNVQILTGGATGSSNVVGYTNGGGGAGDINIEAGSRIVWTNAGGVNNDNALLTLSAANDINALDDILIQNIGFGNGIDTNEGGIVFNAGGDINIGSATNRTAGVAIGSEFGFTALNAGVNAASAGTIMSALATVNAGAGDINVIGGDDDGAGGDVSGAFAHVGFIIGGVRGNNVSNGTVRLRAGGDVNVLGGGQGNDLGLGVFNFAQVGHGGATQSPVNNSRYEVVGSISILSAQGDINVRGGDEVLSAAVIGHGAFQSTVSIAGSTNAPVLFDGFRQDDISGSILLHTMDGNINVNADFTPEQDSGGSEDYALARVGHGGIVFMNGFPLSAADDISFGRIQGNVALNASGDVTVGADVTAATTDDQYAVVSTIGHGGVGVATLGNTSHNLEIVHESIRGFDNLLDGDGTQSTNIRIDAHSVTVQAKSTAQNSATDETFIVDNVVRSQIGHAPTSTVISSTGNTAQGDGHKIIVEENRIAGNIIIFDHDDADDAHVTVEATITGTDQATTNDAVTARIGHAGTQAIHGLDGGVDGGTGAAYDASSVQILQAHILDAHITTDGFEGNLSTDAASLDSNNQDLSIITGITAGIAAVTDSTAVAQVGHGSDTYVLTGQGAAQDGAGGGADTSSGNGGDITIVRGTVWDGSTERDASGADGDDLQNLNTTDIVIRDINELIIDADTAAALASTDRSNAESQLGHGFKMRLATGDGGTSADFGTAGGAGGDVLVYQGVDAREYGIDNDRFDDYAFGLRGDIAVAVSELDNSDTVSGGFALSITADDTSSLASTNFNSDYATLGHGDVIEITTGAGGDGASGVDEEGDANGSDPFGQRSVSGGRGGHVDVQLGRYVDINQALTVDQRNRGDNVADMGDSRAVNLAGNTTIARQGVSLTEGDIFVTANGAGTVASTVTNAVSPSNNAIVEAGIGHAHRIFADSGDGGAAGEANFSTNAHDDAVLPRTVFQAEIAADLYFNYAPATGANRGGNGGDIRITQGDITDRNIWNANGAGLSVTHDTDADSLGALSKAAIADLSGQFDISSDIFLTFSDEGSAVPLADSLVVSATVNAGAAENNGDVQSTIGHHVRLFAEAGIGGDGASGNTEFDAAGNSLFDDLTGQSDTQGAPAVDNDGEDETALQAGAVHIQPDASGGRGGDALVANGNISGDIVISADRRVSVLAGDGHGGFTKVFATLGHTTDVIAVTQNGGAGGDLFEDAGTGVTFDGGILNVDSSTVSATQTGDNDDAAGSLGAFDHVLVDGNQDDEFNLDNIGGADSTEGEDGIAVTQADIDSRTGSTIQSINSALGTLTATGATNGEGVAIYAGAGDQVIFHDEEADPQFILDNEGNLVQNTQANNTLYVNTPGIGQTANLQRFGRTVATYDGFQSETGLFDARNQTTSDTGELALQVFVDMDQDGDVDLVDFDRDGRLDVVDVDRDGRMDVIDGRANYVNHNDLSAVPVNAGTPNGITGLGVLDYVAVTGVGYSDASARNNGTNWSSERELTTANLLNDYLRIGGPRDFTSLVSDFATANGGRGGDAYTHVGYTVGDISVDTGDNPLGEPDSLVISTTIADGATGSPMDILRANVGHAGFQTSDTSASYTPYRAGREGLVNQTDVHVSADGGDAGDYAVNGNGGRGGNAYAVQGVERDHLAGPEASIEIDHLVGRIWVNTPNELNRQVASDDAARISITSSTGSIDHGDNTLISQIGHTSLALATAANTGGNGASDPGGEDGSSQTEIANGGDGGDAAVVQNHIKGTITVMTAADDIDGTNDVSLILSAQNTHVSGGDNVAISQIGHGRLAGAFGGNGGDGDDGQLSGNGGRGGNATIDQTSILDTGIVIDLMEETGPVTGYDGNGMLVSALSDSADGDVIRAIVGHGDIANAISGNGGDGSPEWNVNEQRNQTANGGDAGNAVINQAGYNYDITLDIGHNDQAGNALEVLSNGGATNNGSNDHILAAIGHGGIGNAEGGAGGEGGLEGAVNSLQGDVDPNYVDSDYNYNGAQDDGDTPYAIDIAIDRDDTTRGNGIFLGTTRRGGHGGDAIVNLNVDGTGRVIQGRDANNDYGIDDVSGADIRISTNEKYVSNDGGGSSYEPGYDGILIQATQGPGTNQDAAIHANVALAGHHGFADTSSGKGGNGIASSLGATISDGDGGDGGTAQTTIDFINGDVSITNVKPFEFAANGYNDATSDRATNIVIETVSNTSDDSNNHRTEARAGHLTQARAWAGDAVGGNAAEEAGSPPAFPATISTQGGDGGDAFTFQGQHRGNIDLTSENDIQVHSADGTVGTQFQIAAVGHRHVAEAQAGLGGEGGTYNGDSTDQSIYFTYEALREYHARRTAGASDQDAFNALSQFEQKLVAPVVDYFENKPGEMEIFLDRLIGNEAGVIAANNRDDNFVNDTDFTIASLVDATGHNPAADDGEIETLSAILAASGHGGNAMVVQGSRIVAEHESGDPDSIVLSHELAASGDITLNANAYRSGDAPNGNISLLADAASIGSSFQMAHVGHQSEAHHVLGGDGQHVTSDNAGANGIGGDGGDAVADQYAHNGNILLNSGGDITVIATDPGVAAHEVRAWVGHRLTIGSDYTVQREPFSIESGKGGDEEAVPHADGHQGNGGDVFIFQRGVISGDADAYGYYGTEIALAALNDHDPNEVSIRIAAESFGGGGDDVETHIGHDFLIHAVKAGDAGRQGDLSGPNGAAEGLLEGNGGDIFIVQSDLGADIDIVGRDNVEIEADTSLADHAHLMIGHERTIGNSGEIDDTLDGAIMDNPRTGDVIAGFGGDAYPEDVNGTAMASIPAAEAGIIEDADSGRIEIVLGRLTDSNEGEGDDQRLVTITSLTEDVDIRAISATGSISVLEIGNQQQVTAQTGAAAEYLGPPQDQPSGDVGGVYIARADISGDLLIQAIDADRANSSDPSQGKAVSIETSSGSGATSIVQIGHETHFLVTTGLPDTARAAFGEDRKFLFETNLQTFVDQDAAGSSNAGERTLRDAQNAVEDMEDLVRAIELALENADRYPANDGTLEPNPPQADAADRGELFNLLASANQALNNARASLAVLNGGAVNEADIVNAVALQANTLITVAEGFQTILDGDSVLNDSMQIADFAEGGDIVYGAAPSTVLDGSNTLNTHTDGIIGIGDFAYAKLRTIAPVQSTTGDNLAEGFQVEDTGVVRGNVDILSGRDGSLAGIDISSITDVIGNDTIVATNFGGTGFTAGDDADDSLVQITATSDSRALTEIGHRRIMANTTHFGGGDTDAAPEAGGIAGDSGSIVTRNTTTGNVTVQAEEVAIHSTGAAGESEVHLLHSSHTTNIAGWSDIQTELGNGGDIINSTAVNGRAWINAEQIASDDDAGDRKILADGLANSFVHLGHQAEDKNESQSDPVESGNTGSGQATLGANRGGFINSSQTVGGFTGNGGDGNLVLITLDAAGDGNASDLILETGGSGGGDIRLGSGEDGTMQGILHEGLSGVNQDDDGGEVTLVQEVTGNIAINTIEDLWLNAAGTGDQSIYVGHDAEQLGQSGEVNSAVSTQYGERVTVTQTVTGNVNIDTTSSFTADLATTAGELHIGHEATQSGFSADDSENPTDLEDVNGDSIADGGVNGGEGPSATGVNDNFDQPDVRATQTVEAGISIVTGEITLTSGKADRLQVGHEVFHSAAVDGDLFDNFDGSNQAVQGTSVPNGSTGHVVARSVINADGSDILFSATGMATSNDDVLAPVNGTEGDIQLIASAAGDIHVGHRSTSTMGDVTPGLVPEGQYDALQAIGNSALDADGNEVANTSESVIEFRAVQDIILESATGTTQVGHFITEEGNPASTTSPVFVDDNAATGLAEGDSELRQIVGSDIIFGDNTNQASGGVGALGAGNNLVVETATGRTMIGHQSPDTNEWQVEDGARSVTVQLLDGDITVEAGTDAGADAPDGTTIGSAAAAVSDETGAGDDILIQSGGGVARIGHNIAGQQEGVANETQRAAGNVWVRAGGDVHIAGGAVGHENYDFTTTGTNTANATPESLASGSPIRDRLRGITTIGAGQNSAEEDSILIADVLVLDGGTNPVEINSGYGGQGDRDVDGELRFFLPAQEGLTVVSSLTLNDSAAAGDAPVDRTADPSNVFEGQGGNNHEHEFTFMSEVAPYTDDLIGLGNFTFYFESTATPPDFTPYLNLFDLDNGFTVVYGGAGSGHHGTVNIGSLAGSQYFGTSSQEVACDELVESGAIDSKDQCNKPWQEQRGIAHGFGSNSGFSSTAGGNQTFPGVVRQLTPDAEGNSVFGNNWTPSDGMVYRNTRGNDAGATIAPIAANLATTTTQDIAVVPAEQSARLSHDGVWNAAAVVWRPRKVVRGPQEGDFAEYVTGAAASQRQVQAAVPNALSVATSFTIYREQPL